MSISRSSGNLKVVADYSSEEERETSVQKVRKDKYTSHHKTQERFKKDEMRDSRDKRSSQRCTRTGESSSDESINRRHNKGSRKHSISIDKEGDNLYDRTAVQLDKYRHDSDSSDHVYDKRYNKKEAQKNKYKNKDKISDSDRRDERRPVQKRMHRYDHDNSDYDRKEIEKSKHRHNDNYDRRKEEKSRYYWDGSDSDDYRRREINKFEEYVDDRSNRKNNRKNEKTETFRNRPQNYEHESDYERSKRRQTQKSQYQQDSNDGHNRSGRQDIQSEDESDNDDIRYIQETGFQSDCDDSDYDKRDEKRQYADKSINELEDDRHNNGTRKDKQHTRKGRDWSSDSDNSSEHDKQNKKHAKKSRCHQDDGSVRDRRKDKKSLQNSIYQHDNDDHDITSERQQSQKNKYQQNDDFGTDCNRKGLHKGSRRHDNENYRERQRIEKSGFRDDNGRNYNRQKDNRKAVQESKNRDDSESSDVDRAKDDPKSRQDRCRWDSDQNERDDRRKSQKKYQQNNDGEYDRRDDDEKYLITDRSNIQKNFKDLREDNRHEQKKSNHRERSSEIQHREKLTRKKDDRDHSRKEKQNESELQNKATEENENAKSSDKNDVNDGIQKKQNMDNILTRTGGAYIPPARLRAMQEKITDKSSVSYQRIAWEALKKSINGLINKVNVSNLKIIVKELFKENVIRAKGILARSIMQAQAASPTFTHVYAALVAIINTKFPHIGELIIKRLIIQFRRGFRRNDKQVCLACTNFIAHLVNQQTAHEVLALEILTLLLENPTDDSVELAVGFLKECGSRLSDATRRGTDAIFDRLRSILHDGEVDKRVQYMIEVMFAVRKDKFKDHPAVVSELDIVVEEDQFTHLITLEDAINPEDILNVFRFDPEFEGNEAKYEDIRKALLESSDSEDENSDDDSSNDNEDVEDENKTQTIIDNTETNLISLRRTIYLTIQSSLDFEECAHKLLKLELKPGQIVELCYMILDCCAQQRTYEKFFGLLAQRFCQLNKIYVEPFEEIFKTAYDTIHRFETNKLRNVARFFAHLFYTDAISWQILSHIKLNEDDTTSSSRIFVKILFQELCEYMGLLKLNERVKDPTMQEAFEGLFPRDSPRNTRFAINFFTSIGLGGLTDELREHLKNAPKATAFPSAPSSNVSNGDNINPNNEIGSDVVEVSPSIISLSSDDEPRSKKAKQAKKKKKRKNQDKQSKKRKEKLKK